jgi:hypothetical protein
MSPQWGPTGSLDRKLVAGAEWGCIPILEVVMRSPWVFVRSLSHQEAVRLKRMSTRFRAAISLASKVKTPAGQIARMWFTDESDVREVIHEFNERRDPPDRPRYPRRHDGKSPAPNARCNLLVASCKTRRRR